MTTLADLLEQATAHALKEKLGSAPMPDDEAADALREHFKVWATQHRFEPGQIIRQKRGVADYKGSPKSELHIFLEYADAQALGRLEPVSPYSNEAASVPDALIGELSADGGMTIFLMDSRRFEPVPGL